MKIYLLHKKKLLCFGKGCFLSLLMSFIFAGCQTLPEQVPVIKNGKEYGVIKGLFQGRWWHYYERALSYAEGAFWDKSEFDLREAIRQRGYDKRRSRTYGLHFIEYFPHRELGVSLFHQKHYKKAIDELKISLESEVSAKAEYYLDKARKSWIEQNKLDKSLPEIRIDSPKADFISNAFKIKVKGLARDDTFVKNISINDQPVLIDLSAPEIPFEEEIKLEIGENIIRVEANDLTGKVAVKKIKILCDRAGPILNTNISEFHENFSKKYFIRGYAYDDSGIKTISIDGKNILKSPIRETAFDYPCILSESPQKITLIAEDLAGNQTRAEIFLPLQKNMTYDESIRFQKPLFASLDILPFSLKKYYARNQRGGAMSKHKGSNSGYYKKTGNYALIIGINDYAKWVPLRTAVNDAIGLKDVLIRRYGFMEKNVKIITNKEGSRSGIVKTLRNMAGGLGSEDNLLIYFAGHGQLDDLTNEGYWIPVEGEIDDPCTWITNSVIKKIFGSDKIRGKNVMIVADSCYSGNLLRGGAALRSDFGKNYEKKLLKLASKRSRQAITSGGLEPVADGGRDGHSLFAYYLITALKNNKKSLIAFEDLFNSNVRDSVIQKGGQRPIVGRLQTPMDEDGQFVLTLKGKLLAGTDEKSVIPSDEDIIRGAEKDKKPDIDSAPPTLEIKGWKENQSVFLEKIYFEGYANDTSGIQSLTINGQNILRRPGSENLYFNYLHDLKEGDNRFIIECTDAFGNQTQKEIVFDRKLQKIYELDSRMSVAIFPFKRQGTQGAETESRVMSHLIDSKRFHIKKVDKTMLLNSGDNSEQDAEALAKKLGVDFVMSGKIVTTDKSLQISAQMFEVNTSDILTYQDVYGEDINPGLIDTLSQGLVIKLSNALPLIEGIVVKVKGKDEVIVNRGENHQIKKGMHLLFFEEGEAIIDPETGENLGSDTEIFGKGRVEGLKAKMSHSKLLTTNGRPKLKVRHKFITQ
ncbi:metacaspase-1 [Candidatus Magnetomoraceae bacterium gMMP-15]